MASIYVPEVKPIPEGIGTVTPDTNPDGTPFRVSVVSLDGKNATIKVNRYSSILKTPNLTDSVTLVGIDYNIKPFTYGQKVWVEVFYDSTLTPVIAWVKTGSKWPDKTIDPANQKNNVAVYPNQIELITKLDLNDKIKEIRDLQTQADTIKGNIIDDINQQVALGYMSADDSTTLQANLQTGFQSVKDALDKYASNMNSFFTGASGLQRKQFKSFTLLAFTTKNFSAEIDGTDLQVVQVPTPTDPIPQATADDDFKLIQALHSDLLLADIFYQDRYPCKIPIPYHRAIYNFTLNGKNEETTTTADS